MRGTLKILCLCALGLLPALAQENINGNNPETRPISSQGVITVRNGRVDATRASLDLTFPLGPALPGGIPACFGWSLNGWKGGVIKSQTEFRPVVLPRFRGESRTSGYKPERLSATLLGVPQTYSLLTGSSSTARYGAYTKDQIKGWFSARGVQFPAANTAATGPYDKNKVGQYHVWASSDGTSFLILGFFAPEPNAATCSAVDVCFKAVMRSDIAAWWSRSEPNVTHIGSRWPRFRHVA